MSLNTAPVPKAALQATSLSPPSKTPPSCALAPPRETLQRRCSSQQTTRSQGELAAVQCLCTPWRRMLAQLPACIKPSCLCCMNWACPDHTLQQPNPGIAGLGAAAQILTAHSKMTSLPCTIGVCGLHNVDRTGVL